MAIRALEFYSGIGGLHKALLYSKVGGSVVQAFDWDQSACQVYEANYGADIVQKVDISKLRAPDLACWRADLWLLSPSCQPYTVLNPLAKGAADSRAKSFIYLMENVLPDLVSNSAHPRYMMIENVAGFETSSTRQRLLVTLASLGYTVLELLLTPLQFGIPNSRLRYYMLAKFGALSFSGVRDATIQLWRHIPGHGHDWVDPRLQSDHTQPEGAVTIDEIRQYLDDDTLEEHARRYVVPDHVLEKWGRLFDIILPSARRSCCFTRGYAKMAERSGSVLQMNEELDTASVFDRFLKAQKEQVYDAPAIREAADEAQNFRWPVDVSTKTRYRLIGNSVNVRVVTELVNYLFEH